MRYILALDQGTTSSRSIVFDEKLQVVAAAQKEFELLTPHAGWVEQDPEVIWQSQITTAHEALLKKGIKAKDVAGIGIANQRETTLVWHKKTGKPIYNAIVWQDRRTADWCHAHKQQGLEQKIQQITGLRLDPYFSASKLVWILDNVPEARQLARSGELAFGTVDSWLIYKLSGEHVMDVSNASRTMLMDLATGDWSHELLETFDIPQAMLPKIVASGMENAAPQAANTASKVVSKVRQAVSSKGVIAKTTAGLFAVQIPIYGAIGDQQSALFGHGCLQAGMAKNTYGTGCFMLMNTGENSLHSQHQLLTTTAWQLGKQPMQYALEGSVFMAGAVVQWLRDNLGFIKHSADVEKLAAQVQSSEGVVLVPAFTGLGAPHWQPNATASLTGLTRGTTKAHIARAALEAIAFQVNDVLTAMQQDAAQQHTKLTELRVDGGACANNMLMQFQADILGVPVLRPKMQEATALGAAKLAGLGAGLFTLADLADNWQLERAFEPSMNADEREAKLAVWQKRIQQSIANAG